MTQKTQISRRTALKGIGGVAVLGAGGYAFTGSGAAGMTSTFDASPMTIASDTGDVDEVHLDPVSTVEWANFDVPVTKVRQALFARIKQDGSVETATPDPNPIEGEDGWWPIYRETPWLFQTGVSDNNRDFYYGDENAEFAEPSYATGYDVSGYDGQKDEGTSGMIEYPLLPSATPGDRSTDPSVYVVKEGSPRPDYADDYDDRYLTGVSIDGGGNYINGSYGTVGDTSCFDNPEDGTDKVTTVELALLTTLHTDYDFAENVTVPSDSNPDRLAPLAMGNSPDVSHQFGEDTHTLTYAEQISNAGDHPAVTFDRAAFNVTAENEPSAQGADTTGNTGGS